jgi:hypothetical protein
VIGNNDDYQDPPEPDVGEFIENNLDEILEHTRPVIHKELAQKWLSEASLWLAIINCIGEGDKEYSRSVFWKLIANELNACDHTCEGSKPGEVLAWCDTGEHDEAEILARWKSQAKASGEGPNEEELFGIASRVATVLEEAKSPYSDLCKLGDDLSWVTKVVNAARSIRDIILALSEADPSPLLWFRTGLHSAVTNFNSFLTDGAPDELNLSVLRVEKDGIWNVKLSRRPKTSLTPLHSAITQSIAEYLVQHRTALDLAVCMECSRIFERARRDNVFCSKTCQNRVAYKRKRMIDSGFLVQLPTDALTAQTIRPGLWVNHPRWGLGVIEAVRFTRHRLIHRSEDGKSLLVETIAESQSVEEVKDHWNKSLPIAKAEKVPEPESLIASIRYLSGIVRPISYADLFGSARAKNRVAVFEVRDREALMRLI